MNNNLEINFTLKESDFRKMESHNLITIKMGVFFVLGLLSSFIIIGILVTIIGVIYGFNFLVITWLSVIGFVILLFAIVVPILSQFSVKGLWNRTYSKLPLDKNYVFTDERIIIDEIYNKMEFEWKDITKVEYFSESYLKIIFNEIFPVSIPIRVLTKSVLSELYSKITQKIDQKNIKFTLEDINFKE